MYTTCFHCHNSLDANEVIEHFPVGRKLAFDAARGRLWVVCRRCRRWNLTPVEERWEAIDECERLYRATPRRTATDTIGLARVAGGIDVIRVGRSKGAELAAWRYAGVVTRRWVLRGAPLGIASFGAAKLGSFAGSIGLIGFAGVGLGVVAMAALANRGRARVLMPDGRVRSFGTVNLHHTAMVPTSRGWGVAVGESPYEPALDEYVGVASGAQPARIVLEGEQAHRALRSITTLRNFAGAPRTEVDAALRLIEEVGDPQRFLARVARVRAKQPREPLPREIAIAVEMALHDDLERRAMEGELALLEQEWLEAEEIAKIADDMFVPVDVRARLESLKAR